MLKTLDSKSKSKLLIAEELKGQLIVELDPYSPKIA